VNEKVKVKLQAEQLMERQKMFAGFEDASE